MGEVQMLWSNNKHNGQMRTRVPQLYPTFPCICPREASGESATVHSCYFQSLWG